MAWAVIPGGMREWLLRKLSTDAEERGTFTLPATINRGEEARAERKAPVESDLVNDDGTTFKPGRARPYDPWRPESHL